MTQGQETRLDEAVKLAEQCIAAHPQKTECHEALGNALGTKAMMGGIMSAIGYASNIRDAFKKTLALSANPRGADVMLDTQRSTLVAVGTQYVRAKQFTESQRVFTDIEKRYPDSNWGAYGLARVLQEQGKHQEALPLFERALSVEAAAHVHYRLGQSLQAVSDKGRSIAAYEKALGFKPALSKKQRGDAQDQLKTLKG